VVLVLLRRFTPAGSGDSSVAISRRSIRRVLDFLRGEGDGDGDGDGDSMGVRGRGCWIGLTVVMMGSGEDDESMSG
jgi:hypothetical protein